MKKKIPWKNGYLILEYTSDHLVLHSPTISFEIRPRTIVVNGFNSYRENSNKKKYIYIYFREELKPYRDGQGSLQGSRVYESIDIRHVKTHYDEYYTIILPGSFFIDYIVFTSEELAIILSGKKKTFYEEIDSVLTIYIV